MNPDFCGKGRQSGLHAPPFTVIGELDSCSGDVVQGLYSGLTAPVIEPKANQIARNGQMKCRFHALKITFANEIGNISKRLGLDGREVMEIFCKDDKLNVSPAYLQPGFAFGGSCLPKDLRALLHKAKELDLEPPVLRSVLVSNTNQVEEAYRLIKKRTRKRSPCSGHRLPSPAPTSHGVRLRHS